MTKKLTPKMEDRGAFIIPLTNGIPQFQKSRVIMEKV